MSKKNGFNSRLKIRSELRNHKTLYSSLSPFYKFYYSLTGNIHTLPDYLIIGAAKCGTSSLYEYLIKHPNVKPALGKEINYFDMHYQKGIQWYRSYFPLSLSKKFITGEATPRYLDHPHAPMRIKKLLPKIKIIILLRNPVDRAYSHWNMMVRHNREDLSFEEAIKNENERTSGLFEKMSKDESFYSREYYWYSYVERGMYAKKIQKWMEIFSKNQFLILKSEDLFSNPSEIFKLTQKFLNIPELDLSEYGVARKGMYKKSTMSPNIRKELSSLFKPHNEKLYSLIGKNFEWDE